jgi:hypothetical protein
LAILCLMAALLQAGCEPYMLKSSAVDQFPGAHQEIEFIEALEKSHAVTNNDALHSFLILQDGIDPSADYQERVAEGVRRKWLSESFKGQANQAANVGWMAGAGCRIMNIKGGLTMMVFGPVDHFAVKELIYMEILPLRTDNQTLSGLEFVDYINRLERIAGRSGLKKGELELDQVAGQSAITPGNEAAIQEGTLPASGPLEVKPQGPDGPTPPGSEPMPFPEPVNSTTSPSPPPKL